MPLYELVCHNRECPDCGVSRERFLHLFSSPNPACDLCGGPTDRGMSRFAVVFTGEITARYNDPKLENASDGAHWVYQTNKLTGKREPRLIRTWDEQRSFCREEGITNPSECGDVDVPDDSGRPHLDMKAAREVVIDSNRGMKVTGLGAMLEKKV